MEISEPRQAELRKKLEEAIQRYHKVFKISLSVDEVLSKLEELKLEEKKKHFVERLGPVTELDCTYLIDFLKGEQKKLEVEKRIEAEKAGGKVDGENLEHSPAASENREKNAGRAKAAKG